MKYQDLLLSSYNTRRKVFVNKTKLKNTGITIIKSLTKRRMGFLKKAKNEFGFNNVWRVDRRIYYYDEVANIFINFCGFLRYGKHKIESFFYFWVCLCNGHATAFHI